MNILQNFVKTYTDKTYKYTAQVNHKGIVVAFAMDELRRIYYSVLDLENTQLKNKSSLDVNYWLDNPKEISFPNELVQVGYAILPNIKMPLVKKGTRVEAKAGTLRSEEVDPFLSTTARFTAQAPFQVLSDGQYIYLFRQAIDKNHSDMIYKQDKAGNFVLDQAQQKIPLVNETLLVDRYILTGTELKLKMEVRYQRSRHKYNPQTNKDGLGAKDLEKNPFLEPTQELDFVRNLKDGRFNVLLLPTQIAELERWQIFIHNNKTGLIDSFNVERSKDGLFNTKGTQLYTSPDPQYQSSVLERQPGTDSFTGSPLIPIVSKSGYAESALNFDAQDDYVELPSFPEKLFENFTLESWVYYRRFANYSRIFDFGNGSASDNIILTNTSQTNNLKFEIYQGDTSQFIEIANTLETDKWIHLSVTMDQTGNVTVYKDGLLIGNKKLHLPKTLIRNRNYLGRSNWPNDAFLDGKMDEVRIWNRCRSQAEIQAEMHHRLVGDEPGLWAYWRFDEGFGDRLYDQTQNAIHGSIKGPTWVKSDAPIGDHPGIQRTSFQLQSASEKRQIVSGLSAILYHQQEKVATGYEQQEKPVKRNARVMLTVATSSANPASNQDNNFIAAIDFAVSREGKIAQIPDNLVLPSLQTGNAVNQDLDAVSRLQEEIANLKASINQLEIEIAALKASTPRIASLEAQKARLQSEIDSLTNDLNNKKLDIFNYFCRIQVNGNQNYWTADSNGSLSHKPRNDNDDGQYWTVLGGYQGSRRLCPLNHLTTRPLDNVWLVILKDRSRGLIYDGSFKVDNWWERVAGMLSLTKSSGNDYNFSIQADLSSPMQKGVFTFTKTDRATSVITDLENAIRSKQTELTNTINELNKLYIDREQIKIKESQLALQKVQLENKETELEFLRSGIQGEIAIPMSLLHTDTCGLTVAGGLLNFAYTKDTPLLVNSATGKLALYFRGLDDQFFVTYYDTNTTKARYLLDAEIGKVSATARSAERECDRATFIIADSSTPETCTLTITNQVTGIEETWNNLPREVEQFCNILNGGASQPIFIGKLAQPTVGKGISSLTLSQKVKQTLPQGSLLSLGNQQVVVSAETSATKDIIPIIPTTLKVPADTPIYFIRYDYDAWATNNRTSNPLRSGSLQFIFQAGSSSKNIQNGIVNDSDTTRSCQWVAESPGRALTFDGKDDYVGLGDTNKLSQFDAKGDLTLETWVRPAQLAANSRIIHHNSAQSQYTIGIQSQTTNFISALQFNGTSDYVEVPYSSALNTNEFTTSFWVKVGGGGGHRSPLTNRDDFPQRGYMFYVNPDNNWEFLVGKGAGWDGITGSKVVLNTWTHIAGTLKGNQLKLYVNGKLEAEKTVSSYSLNTARPLRIGAGATEGNPNFRFPGQIDQVQVWNKARSEVEIQTGMNRRLTGNEAGLVAYWQFTDGIAKDYSPNGYNGKIYGQPSLVASVIQESQIYSFAGVGNLFQKSKAAVPMAQWHHLSAVYNQSYALQFQGNGFLECDHNPTLDLDRDLTLEIFLQVNTLSQRQGLLTKGKLGDGTDQNVPYSLYIDTDGKIAFAFEDKQGKSYIYKSTEVLRTGQFYKIAVTRQHQTEVKNQGTADLPNVIVNQWADIRFYVNQKAAGYEIYKGADLDRNSQKLEIGKTYQGSQPNYLQGIISEIRLWNSVVDIANLGIKINGQEKGLVAWWRLEENEGNIASDSKGESHAVIIAAQWVKNPDPQGSSLILYQNGIPVPVETFTPQSSWGEKQFTLGGIYHNTGLPLEPFAGIMEEVRIWKVARTQEQIQDNLFSRIKGEKQDLIANYTFDLESQTDLLDQSLIGNHLTLGLKDAKPTSVLSTAPISEDTAIIRSALAGVKTQFHDTIHSSPGVQEYSDLQYDIEGNLIGIQKRCYGYIKNGQWHLLTGYKVGNLITEWIGQVQAAPQIIGYIEGAPPVPSENLTGTSMALDPGVLSHYNASAIQLVESDTVKYIYSSSKESGFDMLVDMKLSLGFGQKSNFGLGLATEIADVTSLIGAKATFESSQGSIHEASASYGYNTTKISRLQAWGNWEKIGSEINSYVGRRYIPANVGLALVQSDTMDVFALRLAHNNALVSYRFLPNPDIAKDWNIITFPINPTYTKQGTLDGKVGLKEDGSVQPDPHYPNAATYGQWSYFKPIEAYGIKKRIERERQELATYYDQYSTFQNVSYQATGSLDDMRGKQMATRNLANTYVWTADGGFFSESTDVLEATSETTTGFYSFKGMAGLSVDLKLKMGVAGLITAFELDALFGGHLATTKTKGRETEKSFTLEVEVEGERDIQLYATTDVLKAKYEGLYNIREGGVYDQNGKPVKQPGKVDAYRFMTFYLEPTTENFEDFFGKVVDPIWLEQSSDPNAIALRQANQGDKKPSCWRVFHRVTFVSRILPEIAAQNAPPLEKAIRAANIESNWELIKKLEPFVQTKTQDYVTFADAVRNAIAVYLPELQGYEEAIIQYMALYFGLDQVI
ncbi:LamG-like jellyroll fold domain-containing protein [Aliinostoc sp. HNIBRCY26]|uniref:LamG domain-containing protein n=1 Tax=Aliinostoc sp. HNIBRCY26 TaxID=3418997 RepID=UPI003D056D30